jgi:membrane protease YdiL (CAAX protease family)
MVESDAHSTDLDEPATGITAVWVFFAITLVVSAAIVYVIGDRLDNPDAAILAVLVPSTVAIGITARISGWIGVRSLLSLRGKGSGSVRLLLIAAVTVPALALVAIAIGSLVTDEPYDFGMPSEGVFILLPLLIVVLGEEYGWRGFALPGLQGRYSALVATLIVGVVWWVWHYPPSLIETGVPLDTPFWLFGIFVLSLSVLMTSVFNASRGSVGLMMVFHLASNAAFVFFPLLPENRGGDLTTFSIFVGLSAATAVAVVLVNGPASLSKQAAAT